MKFSCQLIGLLFLSLLYSACKKEPEIPGWHHGASEQALTEMQIQTGCDDTSAFKSTVDLQPLEYLKNCYSCTAIKQVPGLGEIPWKANCMVRIVGAKLRLWFYTYEPWFEELLPREQLAFVDVPIDLGIHFVGNIIPLSRGYYTRLWDDGDVVGAGWETDTTCTSYINLTRIDLDNEEIEGEFEIHLTLKYPDPTGILHSERINFLNGRFNAEIEK